MTTKDFNNEYENYQISEGTNTENDIYDQGSLSNYIDTKSNKIVINIPTKRIKSNSKQVNKIQISRLQSGQASPNKNSINLPSSTIINNEKTTNSIKYSITVDTSKARTNLDVVRLCLRELRWKESSSDTALHSDIYWHASSYHEGNTNVALSTGRVNKFPGMNDLLRKVHLSRLLNNMRLLFPNEYDFYPRTWFLPEQNQQFKDDIRYIHQLDKKCNRQLTTFIVKPSGGSQGEGIYLLRDPSQKLSTKRSYVAQEYIDRPLLIDGLKFDLRIYVLILNLYPLEIFLYDEGLVRFATIDYNRPTTANIHEIYMHLTNYSLNRHNINYKHTINNKQTDGSKRKLSLIWKQLSRIYGNKKIEQTKLLITEMINKTILAIVPELRVEYEHEFLLRKKQGLSCFQIVGFDIILDNQLKPILLEVNANPSLSIGFDKENEQGQLICQSSPIDEEIKRPLVLETLKLALPKKQLNTIARHVKHQVNDKIITERIERVAQRRLEERNRKIKDERQRRFDVKLNPFFSRPLKSAPQESLRKQQVYISSSRYSDHIILRQEDLIIYPSIDSREKLRRSIDNDEICSSITAATFSSLDTRQPSINSEPFVSIKTRTDITGPLKLIFSSNNQTKYEHLLVVNKIADIYIQLVVKLGSKTMTSEQFRSFANTCRIIDKTITSSSIDILYYQILKKWQQFVSKTTLTGLPFAAFIEAFFSLSQRKYPNDHSLFDSANHLVNVYIDHVNSSLSVSSIIPQSDQYFLHRTTKNNKTMNSSSLNIRASTAKTLIRSSTAAQSKTSTPVVSKQQNLPTTNNTNENTRKSILKQSTKSVFPLFFDVL
ncbi:unnamed protein product [Adineta steineri]|uniref:Uncharacterized protein n=1 Tax=Adineta steineri TaxID=433720 RepID=A0A814EIY5_9BILA|nr:unnamed protein product [Adineta steineri]